MKAIVLATHRHWNWKVFLVLVGLIIPAAFAILPFEFSRQTAYTGTDSSALIAWERIVVDRLINILLTAALGGVGLMLGNRIGLGMPFVEGYTGRDLPPLRFRQVVAVAWITAIILVLSSLLLHSLVFDPPLNAMLNELGIAVPQGAPAPPLQGFFASLSAAITEETLFRLFGLSLLAWVGGLLLHDTQGRPRKVVFWIANVLFALAFGAGHLATAAGLGLPMNALVIVSTLVLNGIAGLLFGWLFWTFGLECAMLAHFFGDAIVYTLIPLITRQGAETGRYLISAGVVVAILLAIIWACWSLIIENRAGHPQMAR